MTMMLLPERQPNGAARSRPVLTLDPNLRASWNTLLGRLINDGGRLRLYPHRVALFLSLARDAARAEREEFLLAANEALREWDRLARGIGGEHQLIAVTPELSPILDDQMASVLPRYKTVCGHFAQEASQLLRDHGQLQRDDKRVVALARFVATDLLVCMNELVVSFEDELADTAERTQALTDRAQATSAASAASASSASQLAEELSRANGRVQVISFNALIEAARAGEHGATFAAVAQEIKAISSEIGELTERIQAELGGR